MSDTPEIVLIINPSLWYKPMYPSGIMYLASYLRLSGVNVEIIDASISKRIIPIEQREALLVDTILKKKPRIVGFSASHLEYEEVSRINQKILEKNGSIVTIVGGSQPTYRPDDFIQSGFNFICNGEGEKILLNFILEFRKNIPDWSSVKGLTWNNNGSIVRNPACDLMSEKEIDENYLPAYDLVDKRYFEFNAGIIRGLLIRGAMILTTRGCPFKCSFCGCNLIFGKKLRKKSIDRIDKELEYLKTRHGIEGVWIIDDTFTINREHVANVSKVLKKHGLVWGCQSRVNTIDEEMIKIMKDGGCIQIDFGVESGSQRVLDEIIQKGITIEQVRNAFKLARKYKIRTLANFMIALPTETIEEFEMTKALADEIKADVCIFSIATPLPGTKLYDLVGVPITPAEYNSLNWIGSPLTKRLNKSFIADPVSERVALQKKFYLRTLFKSFFSFENFHFFILRGSKVQRFLSLFKYLGRVFN
jgi:anaerobic magnesium-protoporphyrin IX monomethyl ester cyclase